MKRLIKIFVISLLIFSLFLGCNKKEEPKPKTENEEVEIGKNVDDKLLEENDEKEEIEEEKEEEKDFENPELLHPIIKEISISGNDGVDMLLSEVTYGKFTLEKNEKELYPKLQEALEKENEEIEDYQKDYFESLYELGKDLFSHEENKIYGNVYNEIDAQVMRADTNVFSIHHFNSYDALGPHGSYSHYGRNFDTKTGEILKVSDVITDMEKLEEIIRNSILNGEKGNLVDETLFEEFMSDVKKDEENISWIIDYDSVIFLFNPYDIAPYAAGNFSVNLPFEEYPDLFLEKYTVGPSDYIKPIIPFRENYLDFGDEGIIELGLTYYGEEYDVDEMNFWLKDEKQSINTYAFDVKPYLVHKNGKSLIYVFCSGLSSDTHIRIFDIKDGKLEEIELVENMWPSLLSRDFEYLEEDGTITRREEISTTFTDTENGKFQSTLFGLSTVEGTRDYFVNDDGILEPLMDYYLISDDWKEDLISDFEKDELIFTTKVELRVNEIDGENLGEEITLPVGTEIKYIRTDDDTWADFRLEDGKEVRASINAEEYTICDIDIFDALDGLFIAG